MMMNDGPRDARDARDAREPPAGCGSRVEMILPLLFKQNSVSSWSRGSAVSTLRVYDLMNSSRSALI